jgi:cyclopropane-fatty-acyl-phospholipid synthase
VSLKAVTTEFVGPDANIRFEDWQGETWGPTEAPVVVRFNSIDAVKYLARHPGELGFGRAYVSGAMDIDGDIWTVLDLQRDLGGVSLSAQAIRNLLRMVGLDVVRNPPPVPPEEVKTGNRFRAHTRSRDRRAISHHYDVSNDFYRMVLGPAWTYSCAVFENAGDTLEQAQSNKHELVCRKLGLQPGQRLLDVGCGWGSMAIHAARHYGVDVVGITISENQAALARQRVAEAGLEKQIDIRLQDYRDLDDEPFDAISSIGMFEHVGLANLKKYFVTLHDHLKPRGRLLNHQIGRKPRVTRGLIRRPDTAVAKDGFIQRYVFPDGELHEVGNVVTAMQETGFEARHLESLREHYALTLRHWVTNLENNWDAAVAEAGEGKARVWRLYMAATAVNFANGHTQVHQILGVKTPMEGSASGRSGMPFRSRWEFDLNDVGAGDSANTTPMVIDLRDVDRPRSMS